MGKKKVEIVSEDNMTGEHISKEENNNSEIIDEHAHGNGSLSSDSFCE